MKRRNVNPDDLFDSPSQEWAFTITVIVLGLIALWILQFVH